MKAGSELSNILLPRIAVLVLALGLFYGAPGIADTVYDAESFPDLYAAVAAIGKTNAVLVVAGRNDLRKDISVPGNITLRFLQDGLIIVEKGKTVTVESPVQAPMSRVFAGDGSVVLKRAEVYSQWWGARGDGINDDGYAIQAAIDSVHAGGGGVVRLPIGTYLLDHITGAYYALKSKDRVSVIGEGKASVLKVGNNLRTATRGVAVLYNHEEPISECRFAHFTVDYNGRNNLRLASWGKNALLSNVSRLGAEFASNVVIEDVHFKDVTGHHCVWIGNHASNRNNTVRNCTVTNVGQSVPGNQVDDHSSIYIGGSQGLVTGNVFHNQTPCNVSTAIEIHSSDTIVSNNIVTNYGTAVNIGGEANDCLRVTFADNIFKNCRNGIVLWHYVPYVMKNITITGNSISIRETDGTPYPPSMGIIYGSGYVTSKKNMTGLTIIGNTIFQEATTAPNWNANTAIHLEGVDDVTISGNTIYDINGEAVYMESRSAEQGMRGIIITGNNIRNVGLTSTPDRKRAIAMNAYRTVKGSINDVLIQNNIIAGSEKAPIRNGIAFNEGSFPRVDISGNTIQGSSSAEIVKTASGQGEVFHVDHVGKGAPENSLRATSGSRWIDAKTGRVYLHQEGDGGWR